MGASQSLDLSQPTNLLGNGGGADLPLWCALVLEFSDWKVRGEVSRLSRSWRQSTSTTRYYRFLCTRLARECGVYIPPTLPYGESWNSLFREMFKLRALWNAPSVDLESASAAMLSSLQTSSEFQERFKVSVFAKFRPLSIDKKSERESEKDKQEGKDKDHAVTLPLHQRLAMIRMAHKTRGKGDALKILTEEGGWFRARWENEAIDGESEKENRVGSENTLFSAGESATHNKYVPHWRRAQHKEKDDAQTALARKRRQEQEQADKLVARVQSVDAGSARVVMLTPDIGLREFSFDGVLPPAVSQRHAYEVSVKRLVMDALNGFNATAIVYGQTGSGKTFSMFGKTFTAAEENVPESRGIVPRACEELLQAMALRRERDGIESALSVSYVEVYGDAVSDLLRNGARCGQSKVAAQRFVLSGAAEQRVASMDEIYAALRVGEEQKRRAATAMNDRSSRAHSLFILSLSQRRAGSAVTLRSRLFLADLGGSEQVKKSQVDAGATRTGLAEQFSLGFEMATHMREAVYINLGLLALKKCIEALNARSRYVPFQDSKLTMLLSEGIAGNSKTSIIVCANMDPLHAAETAAALRFGERCALIETSARNNATVLEGILRDLDERVAALEREILAKERWEVREERREDQLAEEGTLESALGGRETRTTAVVVGAEEERRQLAALLQQRAQFAGSLRDEDLREMMMHDNAAEDNAATKKREKKVVGFGGHFAEIYGIGDQFDAAAEELQQNERFQAATSLDALPLAVRQNRGLKSWATGEAMQESAEALQKRAQKVKRNRLAYSGISA